jgi:hypothetical protein
VIKRRDAKNAEKKNAEKKNAEKKNAEKSCKWESLRPLRLCVKIVRRIWPRCAPSRDEVSDKVYNKVKIDGRLIPA